MSDDPKTMPEGLVDCGCDPNKCYRVRCHVPKQCAGVKLEDSMEFMGAFEVGQKMQEDQQLKDIKIIRLTNLLGEIVQQATDNPAKLTAFNSPLLSKACIELWNHNNPDSPVDERTAQIYDQMAKVGYNV